MNAPQTSMSGLDQFVRLLVVRPKRWLVPAAVVAALAAVYGAVRPSTWEATQALIVRNEASNNQLGPGKFHDVDQMKTVQETILELARSRDVLAGALQEVGPPDGYRNKQNAWPGDRDVARLRQSVKLVPPRGAEFGKTEVFYLEVRDGHRERTVALSRAICDRLQSQFQQLRDAKAKSMMDELAKTVQLAKADLAESTAQVAEIEKGVGSDLAELRSMGETSSGESALRRTVSEIRAELRQSRASAQANRELLALLGEAEKDPGRLLAAPSRLLESQPALRRLKEGLVDAQLRTAALLGRMSEEHPLVLAAREAEEQIGRHLHRELAIALRGLQADLRMDADRARLLDEQLALAPGEHTGG